MQTIAIGLLLVLPIILIAGSVTIPFTIGMVISMIGEGYYRLIQIGIINNGNSGE